MRGNPSVDELLRRMRRRERFRPALKSLDPTFKPQRAAPVSVTFAPGLLDDDSLEAFLLDDGDDTPPPPWKRALGWLRDESRETLDHAIALLKEDGAVSETLAGLLILAAGTAVGFLWHAYRDPLSELWCGLVNFVLLIVSILGRD